MAAPERPLHETADWLDKAVQAARELCKQHRVPEKSTLRGLVNFAQSTPSPEEVALFIDYQATRQSRQIGPDFLQAVAAELRQRWSGNIDETRRFLGILVRAGTVRLEQRRQERREQGDRPRQPGGRPPQGSGRQQPRDGGPPQRDSDQRQRDGRQPQPQPQRRS